MFGGIEAPPECIMGMIEAHEPSNSELNESLQRFWQLDNLETKSIRSTEEKMCEDIFVELHERLPSGRFVVPVPLKKATTELGVSKPRALRTLRAKEAKFNTNDEFRQNYVTFMNRLIEDEIMTLVENVDETQPHFYVPHHGIQPPKKKFRTVFNGSAVTSTGESLNSIQMAGERLQQNINEIFVRFRLHRIGLTGDITQMYPQVLIKPEFRNLQLALWRQT